MDLAKATPDFVLEEMIKHVDTICGIDLFEKSRMEYLVLCRAAVFSACRGLMTPTRISRRFGMNHATVLHHWKNHDTNLTVGYYLRIYEDLMDLRARYDVNVRGRHQDLIDQLDRMAVENEKLKSEVRELRAALVK